MTDMSLEIEAATASTSSGLQTDSAAKRLGTSEAELYSISHAQTNTFSVVEYGQLERMLHIHSWTTY